MEFDQTGKYHPGNTHCRRTSKAGWEWRTILDSNNASAIDVNCPVLQHLAGLIHRRNPTIQHVFHLPLLPDPGAVRQLYR